MYVKKLQYCNNCKNLSVLDDNFYCALCLVEIEIKIQEYKRFYQYILKQQ